MLLLIKQEIEMKNRLYYYCPECGQRGQTVHDDSKEFSLKCGECLMERTEIVEVVVERVHPVSEEV